MKRQLVDELTKALIAAVLSNRTRLATVLAQILGELLDGRVSKATMQAITDGAMTLLAEGDYSGAQELAAIYQSTQFGTEPDPEPDPNPSPYALTAAERQHTVTLLSNVS